MDFNTFKVRVYKAVQDDPTSPFRFDDQDVADSATETMGKLSSLTGLFTKVSFLNMVDNQAEYDLPADVRSIKSVKIIDENGGEARALHSVRIDDLRSNPGDGDPNAYALTFSNTVGVKSIILSRIPDRNGTNDIVLTYDQHFAISTVNGTMPFPEEYAQTMIWWTAANMLLELEDDISLQRANILENRAMDSYARIHPVTANDLTQTIGSVFP